MDEKIKVKVLGVSFSSNSAYNIPFIVIIGDENGENRIPIIIGSAEAQSITIALEKVPAPRPLSHDLLAKMFDEFNIEFKELLIDGYKEGVYYAKMILEDADGVEKQFDCRPSDGIAIAVRKQVPIYIKKDIFDELSLNVKEVKKRTTKRKFSVENREEFNEEILKQNLETAIADEDYELAAQIYKELNKDKKE